MKLKFIFTFLIIYNFTKTVNAQNDADVLRYGMLNYGSTARSMAMGNSFGALGADFSTLSINPAGLGLYRHSEFTFSQLFSNRTNDSKYINNTVRENYFKYTIGDFGAVFAEENNKPGHFKSWSFGLGYNRLNDFSGRSTSRGYNKYNSQIDSYIEQASNDGISPQDLPNNYPFDINLAWQTYLIDTTTQSNQLYYFNNATPFAGARQTRYVNTYGGQGEWDFSFGTNYENKLFLGGTIGLDVLHYEENITWQEEDGKDTIPYFISYRSNTWLRTKGSGINLKVGAIYKPNDIVRFGLAIHTPTYYTLSDEYTSDIASDLENGKTYYANAPVFIPFNYNVTTPFRTIGSVALIIAHTASINIDYEYLNYNQGRLNAEDKSIDAGFNSINSGIRSKYAGSHNIRFGGEYAFQKYRFRLGALYSTSPFKSQYRNDKESDLSRYGASFGFGIKLEHLFVDIGYAYSVTGAYYLPYALSYQDVPSIRTKQYDNRLLITIGYRL